MNALKGFYDVSVNIRNGPSLKDACQSLMDLGYRIIAINQYLDELALEPKKKKKKGEVREISDPVPMPISVVDLIKEFEGKLHILNRLTFTFADQLQAHKLSQSKNLKKFHLLAAIPTTQTAFQYACSTLEVDIVTFDPTNKYPLRFNRKTYNMATERGIFFELMYSPAVEDATARKNIIHMSHMYHSFGKSRNVIISSGARHPMQIRGPYDVTNLGLIFGLSEEQTKVAVTNSCRSLLLRAEGRRCGKAVVHVSKENMAVEDIALKRASAEGTDDEMEQDNNLQSAQKRLCL